MSYESAPATLMLATACACCGKPLVDATSVETGVGPECRRRHGYGEAQGAPDWALVMSILDDIIPVAEVNPSMEARVAANRIVHRIAVEQEGADVRELICALSALGYTKLAGRCAERVGVVRVSREGDELIVKGPYSQDFVNAVRSIPGRSWDSNLKANRIPAELRRELWTALKAGYPAGTIIIGERMTTLAA